MASLAYLAFWKTRSLVRRLVQFISMVPQAKYSQIADRIFPAVAFKATDGPRLIPIGGQYVSGTVPPKCYCSQTTRSPEAPKWVGRRSRRASFAWFLRGPVLFEKPRVPCSCASKTTSIYFWPAINELASDTGQHLNASPI